jgi:hypothetical protein
MMIMMLVLIQREAEYFGAEEGKERKVHGYVLGKGRLLFKEYKKVQERKYMSVYD